MPVPKSQQAAYGVLVGAMQNRGMSLEEAKKKTDEALSKNPSLAGKMQRKYGKKKSKSRPRNNKKGKK